MFKYSIIMPVYNAEKTLEISIKSIINQSYENWELIVVDDGSTDNSLKLLKEYSKKDKRIKVAHQKNLGPGPARNYGLELSSGQYTCFIDSDDYFDSDYLVKIDTLISKEKYDLLYISVVNEDNKGNIKNIINVEKYNGKSKEDLITLQLLGIIPWGACSKVVKSELINKSLFQKLDVGEELIYSFDLLEKSKKTIFLKEPIYHYVHNENGQHKKGGMNPWRPVVDTLKSYLIKTNKYEMYSNAVNSLAVRAIAIASYRYCSNYKWKDVRIKLKELLVSYSENYNLKNIYKEKIDKKSKLILFLLTHKLYLSIYIASYIRRKNK